MKTFATPSKPLSAQTPSRRALRERNETFVSGSNMLIKDSIASVNDNNIFDNADVASSTLKSEQIVSPTYQFLFVQLVSLLNLLYTHFYVRLN